MNRAIILAAVLAGGCTGADSSTRPVAAATGDRREVKTTKIDGGSLWLGLSSLRREWVAVHDDELPVDFEGTPGVRISTLEVGYESSYAIRVTEPVVAVNVRFILFDVWGDRTGVLSVTHVEDLSVGVHEMDRTWNLISANEVLDHRLSEMVEHYASIAYVAAVRTATGEVYRADSEDVISVAREYMSDFTDDLLEEDSPRRLR